MTLLGIFVLAGVVSAGVIGAMLRAGRAGPMDMPNARSLHATPVPRSGGVGVLAGVLLVAGWAQAWGLLACLAAVAAISWLDDRHPLPAWLRLLVHSLAALGFCWGGSDGLWLAAGVLWLVWVTNLFNFMDGADALAGSMALIGFGTLGLAAWQAGGGTVAALACAAAGAALGFLCFNVPPARIFLGDVGSIPLGFLAAALGVIGVREGLWPLGFMPLVFSPFVVDATLTLIKRTVRGQAVWHAHREHYYQRLIQSGWSHRRTACVWAGLMLVSSVTALALRGASTAQWAAVLVVFSAGYGVLAAIVDRHWCRHLQKGSA